MTTEHEGAPADNQEHEVTLDDLFINLETSGKAFGFVLSSALLELTAPITPAKVKTFAENLSALNNDERFSPQVSLVISAIVNGMAHRLTLKQRLQGDDPLNPVEVV